MSLRTRPPQGEESGGVPTADNSMGRPRADVVSVDKAARTGLGDVVADVVARRGEGGSGCRRRRRPRDGREGLRLREQVCVDGREGRLR